MAIRYIDTGFYKSPFVRGLKGSLKSFYNFIITDCSGAGIWAKDLDVASLYIGFPITEDDFNIFIENGKAVNLGNGKYLFPDFIEHQYPTGLSEKNPAQKNFIAELRKYNLLTEIEGKLTLNKGALKGLCTPFRGVAEATIVTVIVKDKVEVTETVEVKEGEFQKEFPGVVVDEKLDNETPKPFTSVGKKNDYIEFDYLEFKNIKIKPDEFEKLCNEFTQDTAEKAISYLSDYKVEKAYKTKSDYLTIRRWVIDAVTKQKNAQNGNKKNNKGAYDLICGINASSLASFLGTSTDELLGRATNGTR